MLRLNPRLGAGGEKPFDSLVPKSLDRHSVTYIVTGGNLPDHGLTVLHRTTAGAIAAGEYSRR